MPSFTRFASASLLAVLACGWAAASPSMIGEVETYRARSDDSLLDLARKHDVGYVAIVAANPTVDPWFPGPGTTIVLPTAHLLPDAPHDGIVVNVAEMRLYYFAKKEGVPETYPIGIGEEGSETPHGQTRIVRKQANPVWTRTANEIRNKPWAPKVVPPGPDNPLGLYALYLGFPSVLIHGTDDWRRVGRRDSRGCMGAYPEDIEKLFHEVPVGTRVTVVDQPVKLAWVGDQLYIEVHPSPRQADQLEMDNIDDFEDPRGITKTILAAAGTSTDRLDWQAIRLAAKDRNGVPTQITR